MYRAITAIARRLPPLKRRKRPVLAALVGLLFGAIGVGLYLRSVLDFVIALLVTMLFCAAAAATGSVEASLFTFAASGIYGFHRAKMSNDRLGVNAARA